MRKVFFILGMAALAAVGCRQTGPDVPAEPGLVKIEPVITRATSTNFEQGDQIGLTIVKADASEYAGNACLTYDEAAKAFSGDLKWYAEGGQTCSLKAFYPYQDAGFPESFSVASDQSKGAGASDFMASAKTGVYPQREAVAMVFKHYFSQILVDITNTAGAEIESVTIKDLVPTADIAVDEEGEITVTAAEAASANITTECMEPNTKYRAIVVPQTSTLSLEVKVKAGGVIVTDIPESILKQGYTYTIKAEITPDNVKVAMSGEIQNWEDGGVLDGEQKREVSFHEYLEDGYIEYDDVNYTVAKLDDGNWWMTQNLAFVPAGCTVGVPGDADANLFYPYSTDGTNTTALSDAASVRKYGLLYPAEKVFGTEITASNIHDFAGKQGICPKGWHVPARAEYLALCGNSNKDDSGTETGQVVISDACYFDAAMGSGTVARFNAGGWNFIFSGSVINGAYNKSVITPDKTDVAEWAGSCAMNYYWSSTGYIGTSSTSKPQFFALMTTFNSATKGKVSLSYCNYFFAAPLRCVRNAE